MSSLDKSIDSKFNSLKMAIESEKGKWVSAQGVNAFIVVYPPQKEREYLQRAREHFADEYIIDISQLFVELGDYWGLQDFTKLYKNFRSTPRYVFADEKSKEPDLFKLILRELKKAHQEKKKPILLRTGILYGTGIRNKMILEHKRVDKLDDPLIIFYPGEVEKDVNEKERVYYLGVLKASDYRGQFI